MVTRSAYLYVPQLHEVVVVEDSAKDARCVSELIRVCPVHVPRWNVARDGCHYLNDDQRALRSLSTAVKRGRSSGLKVADAHAVVWNSLRVSYTALAAHLQRLFNVSTRICSFQRQDLQDGICGVYHCRFVTGEHLVGRFYAAAPLVASSGHRMGTLCVGDAQPRTMSAEEVGESCIAPGA